MVVCNTYTTITLIDKYICWGFIHPYTSLSIISLIIIIGVIIWHKERYMPKDNKKSILGELFTIMGDILKGMK